MVVTLSANGNLQQNSGGMRLRLGYVSGRLCRVGFYRGKFFRKLITHSIIAKKLLIFQNNPSTAMISGLACVT